MHAPGQPLILDQMSALADALRSRLLLVLERRELTVSEVCQVLQLPQSTVSRHLKTLVAGGWITSRPDGTRRLYRAAIDQLAPDAGRLWLLARDQIAATAAGAEDTRRLESVLQARRTRSQEFFDSAAGRWDRLRDELFGPRFHLQGLLGLLDESWVFGDLGCGTGAVAQALSPFVLRVVAVDGSAAMLGTARGRLAGLANVEIREGELEALPVQDAALDAASLILVLHHVAEPPRVLAEAARVLRPGGKLVLVDMLPHDRQEFQQEMGHQWLGFSESEIGRALAPVGLLPSTFHPLLPEPSGQGPSLFVCVCKKLSEPQDSNKKRSPMR